MMAFLPMPAIAQDSVQTVINFTGEIVDQNAAPVSGILPLEFRIFTSEKAKKAISTEKHSVSVIDGKYTVTLGESSSITSSLESLFVAVYLDNKELTRQEASTEHQLVSSSPKTIRTETIGSENGSSFTLTCPPGYVVTGIEGSVDKGIQGIRLVCSKTI